MAYRSWLLTAVSALGGAALFIYPSYLYPLVFIFLMPIFWGALRGYNLSFLHGFFWGALFFGSIFFAILVLLHHHADGLFRYVGYFLLVVYFALYPAIWWWSAQKIVQRYSSENIVARAIVWGITGIITFFALHHYSFFIFGQMNGLTVANPLITLVNKPLFLIPLPYIGTMGLWSLILIFQLLISVVFIQCASRTCLLIAITVIALSSLSILSDESTTNATPSYLDTIGYIAPPEREHANHWDTSQEITQKIFALRQRYPEVAIICMPESSCKFALNNYPSMTASWLDAVLHDDCSLLIGSHRQHENKLFNCLYCVQKGPIISTYDKRSPMPFGEYVPFPWNTIKSVEQLFLNNKRKFYAGDSTAPSILTERNGFTCIPQICYELYFSSGDPGITIKVKLPHDIPVLGISNDTWFAKTPYFQQLLLLLCRYRAVEWNRPILYIAHTGGWWLSEDGAIVTLQTITTF